jgi:HPt (histidine-containing phosphotransfer) domain-containing protein
VGKWLYAAYGLRIRELATDAEGAVRATDTKGVTRTAISLASMAYAEGLRFGQHLYGGGGDVTDLPRAKLFGPFVASLALAAKIRSAKVAARVLTTANPRKVDAQSEQIAGEYERAVKRALHRLALDAGSAGIHAAAKSARVA